MKLFLIAAFVALCTASTVYRGKNISVGDDGTILISTSSGKRVVITRPVGYNGQKNIDIAISGPNMPTKRIQIDDAGNNLYDVETEAGRGPWSSVNSVGDEFRLKRSSKKSQGDTLVDICKDYQGTIDEPLFDKLLNRILKAVQKGEISRQIYEVLATLDQIGEGDILGYQQGVSSSGLLNLYTPRTLVGGQTTQGLYGRGVYNLPQDLQLNGGLLQGGVIYETVPTSSGNVLLKEYLVNQQQTPVTPLWRSLMGYQPLFKEGRLGVPIYGMGQQQTITTGQQPIMTQQGLISQYLDLLRRQQLLQGQGIGQGLDVIQQQPFVVRSLSGLTQQQQPIVLQTLGGLAQQQYQQEPIIVGGLGQQQPIVRGLGGLVQQQKPIVVQSLGQQRPIVIQGQQGLPQVVY